MPNEQSDSAQVPPTRQTGLGSATGAAIQQDEREIPSGSDRGSKIEIVGGPPKPDVDGPKNVGAQTEPARFTSNGQLPHNSIPTSSGPVSVGATGLSIEDAQKRVDEVNAAHDRFVAQRGTRQRLAPDTVRRLHAIEIQAIAEQRGYVLPGDGGARMTRAAFLKAQDEDKLIEATPTKKSPRKASKRRR